MNVHNHNIKHTGKGKQNEVAGVENKNLKTTKENSKKKRKAPDVPPEPKTKLNAFELNGASHTSSPLPIIRKLPSTASCESLTSSSVSTDYSATSRSFTFSSFSSSVEIEENGHNLSVKSIDTLQVETAQDPNQLETNLKHNSISDLSATRTQAYDLKGDSTDVENILSEPNECSNVCDYVENAILVSSNSNLLSSSPPKSVENVTEIHVTHHHPPRLTSFESSSTLHHEGLSRNPPSSEVETGFKPCYVTLDFVKSAAAEGKKSRDNGGAACSSSSSLSSSLLSSIDSDVGSTIGSDVVESLYNKITAASANANIKNSTASSPEVKTGDIEKDLFPLIFPGHHRKGVSSQGDDKQLNSTLNDTNVIRPPHAVTHLNKSDDFHNFNVNKNKNVSCSDQYQMKGANSQQIEDILSLGLSGKEETLNGLNKCEICSGVIIYMNQTVDEEMKRIKDLFGECFCNAMKEEIVTELDYGSSNLKEVPEEIYEHSESLLKLSVESNTITELPSSLFQCHYLNYLSVSDNDIPSLPDSLASLVHLKYLDVSKNVIEDLPDCIRCCKNLEILDTSVNPIETLSEGFTQLSNLRELYMNDCFFDFLPASFGRMTQLQVLELRDNQLQILPKSIRRLTLLSRLDIGGNVFQEWPGVISKLGSLRELWMDCNELSHVPPDIGNLSHLTYLDLSRNFLETIPGQIGSLDQLKDLILAENSLTSLPDSIGFLFRLNVLNLELNHIKQLPDSIGKLRDLEEVDLSHNKVEGLPSTIGKLRNLHTLLLDDNKLLAVPSEIGCCTQLNILQLSRNQIDELPDSMGDLANLRVLNVCQNRLTSLPISMMKLKKLEALWISPNQSKPNVPLQDEIDPHTGLRILNNVLFPQEENGPSRAMKLLGQPDEDDSDGYANDAADDDDLDAYARRERGKTQVMFDLHAITYSDQINEVEIMECNVDELDNFKMNPRTSLTKGEKSKISDAKESSLFLTEEDGLRKATDVKAFDSMVPLQESKLSASKNFTDFIDNRRTKMEEKDPNQDRLSADHEKPLIFNQTLEDDEFMEIDSDNEIVIGSDVEDLSPPKEMGLRTWSSRSNLPSALTEQTTPWNPDEDIADAKTAGEPTGTENLTANKISLDLHKEKYDASNVEIKLIGNSTFQSMDKNASFRRALAIDDDVTSSSEEVKSCSMSTTAEEKKHDELSSSNKIPFIDKDKKTFSNNSDHKNEVAKKLTSPGRNSRPVLETVANVSDSLHSSANGCLQIPLKKTFKTTDDICLSNDYVIEAKASSMTSSEGAPGTDHDSGVGNDVESQESVMDVQEEPVTHVNDGRSKPKASLNEVCVSRPYNEGASVKRNKGGWIALVRSENISEVSDDPSLRIQTQNPTSVASNFNANKLNSTPTRYVPASTSDTTKVTYSHEYHKSRLQNRNGSKINRVAEGIKKFENFSEIPTDTTFKSKSIDVANSPIITNSNRQPRHNTTNASTKKPMAVATILSTTVRPLPENECKSTLTPIVQKENYYVNHDPTKYHDDSIDTFIAPMNTHLFDNSASTHTAKPEKFGEHNSAVDYVEDNSLNRRISAHLRKSKFDEALAATKHKHFRDKLEKMMEQQQKDTDPDSKRRMSRGSTSSLASMPRITSPVPHHRRSNAFEKMTAEASHNEKATTCPSRNDSIHSRLKEKLQPPTFPDAPCKPIAKSNKPTSRDRPGSARQIGRRGTAQRSSLRSRPTNENNPDKSKTSLEEQLGQLLLEGNERRFDPVLTDDIHQGLTRKKLTNIQQLQPTGRTIRPSDWKEQLLQYLERKKMETGRISGTVSLGRSYNPEPQKTFSSQAHSYVHNSDRRSKPHHNFPPSRVDVTSGLQYRHATSVPEINEQTNTHKQENFSKTQPAFTRASSVHSTRPHPGRRSSGRYQRTRTPGPEMTSELKQSDVVVRPRSAMDMPSAKFDQVEPTMSRSRDSRHTQHKEKFPPENHVAGAPPSYEDHVRRVNSGAATWNQQDYHDYVNVEYLNQIRASMRKKNSPQVPTAPPIGYPLRSTGSHDSVLNTKNDKAYMQDAEAFGGIKSSASHDSVIDNRLQPQPTHQYPYPVRNVNAYSQHGQHPIQQSNYPEEYQYNRTKAPSYKRNHHHEKCNYGEIPAPPKTTKQSPVKPSSWSNNQRNRSKKGHWDSVDNYNYPLPYCAYPLNPPVSHDGYTNSKRLSAALQPGHPEKEDESVASAFRPYHQHPNPRKYTKEHRRSNEAFDDYPVYIQHHPDHGLSHPHEHYSRPFGFSQQNPRRHGQDHSKNNQGMPARKHRRWRDSDASVEIVTVTIRKNPTFGFHIMGGIDAGGNPYRPDDNGVFITYVAPGGAADQLVQPGDKILLVNGSEFVGITHKRAVDLLRNAGHIAVLVVERLVGRPV